MFGCLSECNYVEKAVVVGKNNFTIYNCIFAVLKCAFNALRAFIKERKTFNPNDRGYF